MRCAGSPIMADATCLVCKVKQLSLLQVCEEPFEVLECAECDFAFVWPQPDPEKIHKTYNASHYYDDWVTKQADKREVMWRRRARRVLKGRSPGKLLDVGCGEGSFLSHAKELGWDVYGTELSQDGCNLAQEQWGIKTFCGRLEDAKFPNAEFDVVTLWHLIEHVPDPSALVREVKRITRPGGFILFACPNRHCPPFQFAYRVGRGKPYQLYSVNDREQHISHFSVKSLRRLLEDEGLHVQRFCVDRGHVQRLRYGIDLLCGALHALTGQIWSEAMECWSERP